MNKTCDGGSNHGVEGVSSTRHHNRRVDFQVPRQVQPAAFAVLLLETVNKFKSLGQIRWVDTSVLGVEQDDPRARCNSTLRGRGGGGGLLEGHSCNSFVGKLDHLVEWGTRHLSSELAGTSVRRLPPTILWWWGLSGWCEGCKECW